MHIAALLTAFLAVVAVVAVNVLLLGHVPPAAIPSDN